MGLGIFMSVNGWWLVISSFKTQYVLFSYVGHVCWNRRKEGETESQMKLLRLVSWNGTKERSRDKEMSGAIKTQLCNYGSLQLNLERGRPLWAMK